QRLDFLLLADVARDGNCIAPVGANLIAHYIAGVLLAGRDDNLGAGRGHLLGDRSADAARGTGDERNLTGQVKQSAGHQTISNSPAPPMPPPLHMVTTAY